jgi:hypothetical protein
MPDSSLSVAFAVYLIEVVGGKRLMNLGITEYAFH